MQQLVKQLYSSPAPRFWQVQLQVFVAAALAGKVKYLERPNNLDSVIGQIDIESGCFPDWVVSILVQKAKSIAHKLWKCQWVKCFCSQLDS